MRFPGFGVGDGFRDLVVGRDHEKCCLYSCMWTMLHRNTEVTTFQDVLEKVRWRFLYLPASGPIFCFNLAHAADF